MADWGLLGAISPILGRHRRSERFFAGSGIVNTCNSLRLPCVVGLDAAARAPRRTLNDPGDSHTRLPTEKDCEMMFEWHDFNARDAATFLSVAAMLILFAVISADVRRSVYGLLKVLLQPIIFLPIIGLLAHVALLTFIAVILGRKVGLWQTPPVVTASVWALTAGVSHLFHLGEFLETDNSFRSRAVALLGPSTILAAFMGVAVLSFWGELILIPVLSVLVLVVNANRSNGLTIVCSVLLLIYVGGSISMVIIDWRATETMRSLRQAILFPFVLTIGTLPYIQLLVVAERIRFGRGTKCKTVRASDYGNDWPLTVTSAKLCCKFQAVWVEVNGRKYGLNGMAPGILEEYGYACFELNDIWRDNPDSETMGLKVNIGRLIRDGLALERQC